MAPPAQGQALQPQQQQQQQTGPASIIIIGCAQAKSDPTINSSTSDAVKHEKSVTISPATSNKNLKFAGSFKAAFTPFSLRRAFKDHVAFHAVFETRGGCTGNGYGRYDSREDWGNESHTLKLEKFPGKIIALPEDMAAAGGGAGKSVGTAAGAAAAGGAGAAGAAGAAAGEFALTSASKGLVSAIMTAYSRYDNNINMRQAGQLNAMILL